MGVHMKKPERISATTQVVDAVRLAIQKGELKVGDKLPRESDMAEELGVGRSSLREGIKILNAYGIVESRQGEGTYIVDNSARNFFQFMGFFPSAENTINYLELRRTLEVGNIVSIYDKITCSELDALEKLVDISKDDCLILYSFPRYSELNFVLMDMARTQGAKIILFTDQVTSPLAKQAED